eukprot:38877-Eustigmatos_ZCMA.PRE.1
MLPRTDVIHMLDHHSCTFAGCSRFTLLLFNQLVRRESARDVKAKVRNSPKAFAQFMEVVNDPQFPKLCKQAATDKEAEKKLLEKVQPFLKLVGKTVRPCMDALHDLFSRFDVSHLCVGGS